ncbi:MAG TPA: hypothetical protein VK034_00150, partial [Enhygromyxa sp.]|nr:hypothetical protein [Enhygromyxa sp.]
MIQQSARPRMILAYTLAAIAAIGCKQEDPTIPANEYPSRMAFGYCEGVYGCQCESYPYDNFNECVAYLSAAYDELNDDAFLAGLKYDGTCPAKELQGVDGLACTNYVPESTVCAPPCNAWYGPFPAGSTCQVVASSA